MGQPVSGFSGTVFGGASSATTDMNVGGWSGELGVGDVDTTTTGDQGWEDSIDGPKSMKGSFDFLWNKSQDPFSNVVQMWPGSGTYPFLKLNLDATGTNFLTGQARIQKLSIKSEVKGAVTLTASFVSKGPWTIPS